MLVMLTILTALCGLAMISGFVWMLVVMGHRETRRSEAAGADMMAEAGAETEGEERPLASTFQGRAVASRSEASISFRDIWRLIEERNWAQAVPVLLLLGGMMGLFLFGSLALLVGMENKVVGGVAVAMALYIVFRTMFAFIKA